MTVSAGVAPERVGRSSMILVGALIGGLVWFGVIALFIGSKQKQEPPNAMVYLGIGKATFLIVLRFVVPNLITAKAKRGMPDLPQTERRQHLAAAYLHKTLIGAAMLDAAGFFNCIAYIITGSPLSIGVVAVLLTIMAVTFPTQTQFENWADQIQRDTL